MKFLSSWILVCFALGFSLASDDVTGSEADAIDELSGDSNSNEQIPQNVHVTIGNKGVKVKCTECADSTVSIEGKGKTPTEDAQFTKEEHGNVYSTPWIQVLPGEKYSYSFVDLKPKKFKTLPSLGSGSLNVAIVDVVAGTDQEKVCSSIIGAGLSVAVTLADNPSSWAKFDSCTELLWIDAGEKVNRFSAGKVHFLLVDADAQEATLPKDSEQFDHSKVAIVHASANKKSDDHAQVDRDVAEAVQKLKSESGKLKVDAVFAHHLEPEVASRNERSISPVTSGEDGREQKDPNHWVQLQISGKSRTWSLHNAASDNALVEVDFSEEESFLRRYLRWCREHPFLGMGIIFLFGCVLASMMAMDRMRMKKRLAARKNEQGVQLGLKSRTPPHFQPDVETPFRPLGGGESFATVLSDGQGTTPFRPLGGGESFASAADGKNFK